MSTYVSNYVENSLKNAQQLPIEMHNVSSNRLFEKTPSWILSQFHSAENVIFGRFDVIAPFLVNLRRSILRYLGNE